ncbi:MAG: hypothetical protein M3400_06600 [Actinomycetota bacterium]|nr:hypothetical protein [Actinomycetota bacterium]
MAGRRAHLVGSIPGDSAGEAMQLAMTMLGPHLQSLPDGETGERRNWIMSSIEDLRAHPDLELAKEGDWSDYDKTPRFRVKRGHRLLGASLDFGQVSAVEDSHPVFEQISRDSARADLDFLVGVPGDFDMAMFSLGPAGAFRHRRAFTEATVAAITRIHGLLGDQAVFQLEVPAELVLLTKLPTRVHPPLARMFGKWLAGVAAASPQGARFGIHLCLGDMNHRAFGRMKDVGPIVVLTQAILAAWPRDRPLEFVHAPFAAADDPPPTEPSFYAPLARLELPAETRFIAGFAHEDQSLDDQREVLTIIEDLLCRPVDIASSCGLGRRKATDARRTLARTAELCAG